MDEKTKSEIKNYLLGVGEFNLNLLAYDVSCKFNISFEEAMKICDPFDTPDREPAEFVKCDYCDEESMGYNEDGKLACKKHEKIDD